MNERRKEDEGTRQRRGAGRELEESCRDAAKHGKKRKEEGRVRLKDGGWEEEGPLIYKLSIEQRSISIPAIDPNINHKSSSLFQQVVWSSSREVGCATKMCAELIGLNWRNASFAICNYAPRSEKKR